MTEPAGVEPPFGEPTYSISELAEELRDFLAEAYGSVWVAGEVHRLRPSQRGHLWFELVEKGGGDEIVGKLDAVLWRTDHLRVRRSLRTSGQKLEEGLEIRCRGQVDFYPAGGRLQLVVRDIDPLFTLGHLERRRRQTLEALAAAGLLECNGRRPLPELALRVGLITSAESAAFHDFLTGLEESGYGFEVFFVHAAVQGREAERDVVSALGLLGSLDLDCIVLTRGGGARTDLAAFDSRAIAEAIARCPLPVLTGLGHEIDRAIADVVSHTALRTPTKVAELLVERVAAVDFALRSLAEALERRSRESLRQAREELRCGELIARAARERLREARRGLDAMARSAGRMAQLRIGEDRRRLADLGRRLTEAGPRLLELRRPEPDRVVHRLATVARLRLRAAGAKLAATAQLLEALAPERLLERGFSITRGPDGAVIRRPDEVRAGDTVTSQLAGGMLRSRVEEL